MKNSESRCVAIGALVARRVAVYFAANWIRARTDAVAGVKGEVKADAAPADAKAAAGKGGLRASARRRRSK